MPQDGPRNDLNPADGLLDFDTEAPNSAREKKEPELFFNRQDREITPGTSAPAFVWHTTSVPIVHTNARRNIGITLLVLGSIGVLAWLGLVLMGMRPAAGTSGAQIQSASQPAPTAPIEAPAEAIPPAPDPQPAATDVPSKTATPIEPATPIAAATEAPVAKAPDAPRAERPAREAERPPVKIDPVAAGGLFAITRPVGAQVFVDNKLIGTTPLFMSQLTTGSHDVRLELPGFSTYSSSIQVEPNQRFRLAVQLEETR